MAQVSFKIFSGGIFWPCVFIKTLASLRKYENVAPKVSRKLSFNQHLQVILEFFIFFRISQNMAAKLSDMGSEY